MKGVQFVVDERGEKTAVVIDLKRHAALSGRTSSTSPLRSAGRMSLGPRSFVAAALPLVAPAVCAATPDDGDCLVQSAAKSSQELDPPIVDRLIARVESLASDPRPTGARKLRGSGKPLAGSRG